MEREPRHIPAFAKPLEEIRTRNAGHPSIELLQGEHANRIVRAFTEANLRRHNNEAFAGRSFLENALLVKQMFSELNDTYHIRVPADFVVSKDDRGEDTLFALARFVEHEESRSELMPEERANLQAEEEHVLRQVLLYFKTKHAAKEPMLYDIASLGQYVYGNLEGEAARHLYLVDLDPYYAAPTTPQGERRVLRGIERIFESIEYMEREYGMDLTAFHDECVDFRNSLT